MCRVCAADLARKNIQETVKADPVPSKEKLPDWLRRWYALKGELRFREAADEIERQQAQIATLKGYIERTALAGYRCAECAARLTAEACGGCNGTKLVSVRMGDGSMEDRECPFCCSTQPPGAAL
jgi:hypothetical protein